MQANWNGVVLLIRHERHPVNNLGHPLEIIVRGHVRNTISIHNLRSTKLQIRCVNFTTQQLVDSCSSSQNDRLTLDLNGTLTKTNEIGTNTYRTSAKTLEG